MGQLHLKEAFVVEEGGHVFVRQLPVDHSHAGLGETDMTELVTIHDVNRVDRVSQNQHHLAGKRFLVVLCPWAEVRQDSKRALVDMRGMRVRVSDTVDGGFFGLDGDGEFAHDKSNTVLYEYFVKSG